MAFFEGTALIGCSSIPNFITTGSRMVFEQTNPPTSWTKELNAAFNNVALQVVTGTASFGGGSPFTSVFPNAAKGLGAVPLTGPSNLNVNPSGPILAVQASPNGAGASSSGRTITVAMMRLHDHSYIPRGTTQVARQSASTLSTPDLSFSQAGNTSISGSDGVHQHTIAGTHGPGHHSVSSGDHDHIVSEASHSHSFTMTARNFNVNYVDVIICIKE